MRTVLACLLLTWELVPASETVAVGQLTASSISSGEAYSLASALRSELSNAGAFTVMERGQMEELLKEQGFQRSGACDEATCAVEIGQLLSVKYMVLGHVGLVGKTYTVGVRLVSVETGEIARDITKYHKGSIDNLLTDVLPVIAREISGTAPVPERENRRGLIIAISSTVVALAVAVPVIISLASDDGGESEPQTTDVEFRW